VNYVLVIAEHYDHQRVLLYATSSFIIVRHIVRLNIRNI